MARSIGSEDRGTVTIELALIAPILATLLVGLVDISLAFSNKLRLEQIANRAVERVQQVGFDTATTTKIILEAEAIIAAGAGSTANLTFWRECEGVRQTSYTGNCSSGQATARYVQMEVVKTHTPIITAKFSGSNTNGTITVRGVSGLRVQ